MEPGSATTVIRVRVLGATEVSIGGIRADLGGHRQRAALARLVAAHGRMVPIDRLIEDLWPEEAPPRALVGVRSFVSNLRRALEPGRAPRAPAEILVTAPPGYALRLAEHDVDAWHFDALVGDAGARLAAGDPAGARERVEAALALWAGPAYAEFADLPWASAEAVRLDELYRVAVERRAEVMLAQADAPGAVPELEAHTAANPLREEGWRLLALALYRAGRQGDALSALRRARTTLAEELGVDPGPLLKRLESAILAQDPELDAPAHLGPVPAQSSFTVESSLTAPSSVSTPALSTPARATGDSGGTAVPEVRTGPVPPIGPVAPTGPAPGPGAPGVSPRRAAGSGGGGTDTPYVGRETELRGLIGAAEAARTTGCQVAIITGDAGTGKSALVDELGARLSGAGWTVAVGRCAETDGAPAGWPWAELLRGLAAAAPPPAGLSARLAPFLDDSVAAPAGDVTVARFRLHRAVGDYLAHVAESAPMSIVLEDAHRADDETLTLLAQLPGRLAPRPVLIVVTLRHTGSVGGLTDALAALARHEPVRLQLGGLPAAAAEELIRAVCTTEVDAETIAAIVERTGGNPFFLRETARLVDSEGAAAAVTVVPEGVGDVIRRRLARLPAVDQTILRHAAAMGRDIDFDLLAAVSSNTEDSVVDALEVAVISGLVIEADDGALRFAHALVRDALYGSITRLRRSRMHARLAGILERDRPDDVEAIAHHYIAAAGRETAGKAARFASLAAERAEARFAHDTAAGLWEQVIAGFDRAGGGSVKDRLEPTIRLVRTLALAGRLSTARLRWVAAIAAARPLGDPELLARVVVAFDVPMLWTSRPYGVIENAVVDAAESALRDLPAGHDALRARLLTVLASELDGEATERGYSASQEAVDLARSLGSAEILASALNGRYHQSYRYGGHAERSVLGAELLRLSTASDLGVYQVLAHMILMECAAAEFDFDRADAHVADARRLGEAYGLPLVSGFGSWYLATRQVVAGRYDDAERLFNAAAHELLNTAIWDLGAASRWLGIFGVRLLEGRLPELAESVPEHRSGWRAAGITIEADALTLAAAGRLDEAARLAGHAGDVRPDWSYDIRWAVRGRLGILLGDRDRVSAAYEALRPYAGHMIGDRTAACSLGTVDQTLGELAAHLGRVADAANHLRAAIEVAERAAAPRWSAEARTALDRL